MKMIQNLFIESLDNENWINKTQETISQTNNWNYFLKKTF